MCTMIKSLACVLFVALIVDFISAQGTPRVRPAAYVEPRWYSRLELEDETGLLKRCRKRTRSDAPPKDGDRCARTPKMCYFGTQDCDGVGAHPEVKCVCSGGRDGTMKWQCEEEVSCPAYPGPTSQGCPPMGGLVNGESSSCPDTIPDGDHELCEGIGSSCTYAFGQR